MKPITIKAGKKLITFELTVNKMCSNFNLKLVPEGDIVMSGWVMDKKHGFDYVHQSMTFFSAEVKDKVSKQLK